MQTLAAVGECGVDYVPDRRRHVRGPVHYRRIHPLDLIDELQFIIDLEEHQVLQPFTGTCCGYAHDAHVIGQFLGG